MRVIGILGGMSAASTQLYYQELCAQTRQRLGGLHSPELLIRSLDFAEIESLQASGNWQQAGDVLNREAKQLERGGAELLLLATNTMHKLTLQMMDGVGIPLIHIAEATARAITARSLEQPGLMATAFTMEQNFYRQRLEDAGLNALVPVPEDRAETHRIIYEELCKGIIKPSSQSAFIAIADRLVERGADCLILGCTEVGLLLDQTNVAVPVFDTTIIHCTAALDAAMADEKGPALQT